MVLMLRMDVAFLPYMVLAVQDGTPAHHFPPRYPYPKPSSIQERQSDLFLAQDDGWILRLPDDEDRTRLSNAMAGPFSVEVRLTLVVLKL